MLGSRLSGNASTVRSAGGRYGRRWRQCSRSAWRRSREHKSTRVRCDCSTGRVTFARDLVSAIARPH
eukprot:5676743-Prymnesium_polylepis.1